MNNPLTAWDRGEVTRLRTQVADLTQELATVRATLADRSEAVNRTGESNDRLRAKIARVEKLAAWFEAQPNWREWGIHRQIRTALADQETARD